jgi:hypothetical protein
MAAEVSIPAKHAGHLQYVIRPFRQLRAFARDYLVRPAHDEFCRMVVASPEDLPNR